MPDNEPCLVACGPLQHENLKKIRISCDNFTLGRRLNNSVVLPFLSISRNHCIFRKTENDDWTVEDQSTFGIKINGDRLGKGMTRDLAHEDVITLDAAEEFVYKFVNSQSDGSGIPRKRIKLEEDVKNELIDDVKIKFEESQSFEIMHIEEKIQNTKQLQTTQMILKDQLQTDMNRKMQQLELECAQQIENLKGEKIEVEKQKMLLIEERDAQLAMVKEEMEGKIVELMEQIQKHNETESELLKENNSLKEKLLKEREDFLAELNRESSSKQDILDKLNAKIREQEEIRLKEKQELEQKLMKENELLKLAKEEEIKALEEQKKQREQELIQELNDIKKNLETHIEQSMEQKKKAEIELNEQLEQMKKLSSEDRAKMEQLMKDREEIERKLSEAKTNAEKSLDEAKVQVREREIELAALAAERIQLQADQSSEVIYSLQQQLEMMRSQLQSVETEKNTLLESLGLDKAAGEGTSKQTTIEDVGEVMDSELQCSICAELFVSATTLNCSHTFCKYCITMWKKKKKDCPICRAPITSECRSLVLDSFIERMVQKKDDTKKKREELLKSREELEQGLAQSSVSENQRGSISSYEARSEDSILEEEEYEDYYGDDDYESYADFEYRYRRRGRYYDSDSDSGSDDDSDAAEAAAGAAAGAAAAPASLQSPTGVSDHTAERTNSDGGRRARRGVVPGIPGAAYGGYGRCYTCGARGHWAPGCPNR